MAQTGFMPSVASPLAKVTACCSAMPTSKKRSGNLSANRLSPVPAGMAYEAMNNAGAMDSGLIVILNDNDMSIAPPVGAMSAYLARLLSSGTYTSLRHIGKQLAKKLPRGLERTARRAEEYARGMATGGTLFEELGFYYVGPIDGHNLDHLLPVLKNVRDARHTGPILVHVVTRKGAGYAPAEKAPDKYHGVGKFDVITGALDKP